MKKIIDKLFEYQDLKFKDFNSKLIPNITPYSVIGVKTPIIRSIAKELNDYEEFIHELPHMYHEENMLHASIISLQKDVDKVILMLDDFLDYVDNWAVCDTISPKAFKKDYYKSLKFIKKCLKSKKTYRIRFGIVSLLQFFLDDEFSDEINNLVLSIKSDEYYVNMAKAWYFSFALIKQYDKTIEIIKNKKLDKWTHNKSIQKAIESYRVSNDKKEYLRTLKINKEELC